MCKSKIRNIILAVVLMISSVSIMGVSPIDIVGMNIDSVGNGIVGLCTSPQTLNLTYIGTQTFVGVDASAVAIMKVGSSENGGAGVGYALGTDGGSNTRLITMNVSAALPTLTGNVLVNTAAVPDSANVIRANLYSGGFLEFGTRTNAPCNINPCVHVRGYTGVVTSTDTSVVGATTASGFTVANNDILTSTFWLSRSDLAGGFSIIKLDSGFNFIGSTTTTVNIYSDVTSDGFKVYAPYDLGGAVNIRRVDMGSLVSTEFPYAGTSGPAGAYHYNGNVYVGMTQTGTGNIKRISTTTMAETGNIALGAGEAILAGGQVFDTINNRLYVVTIDGGGMRVRRVNLGTFTVEQNIAIGQLPQASGVGFDLAHQNVYMVHAGANMLVSKVGLCS